MTHDELLLASNNTRMLLDAIFFNDKTLTDVEKEVLSNAFLRDSITFNFQKIVEVAKVFAKSDFVQAFDEVGNYFAPYIKSLSIVDKNGFDDDKKFKRSVEILYSCLYILNKIDCIDYYEFEKLKKHLEIVSKMSLDDIKISKRDGLMQALQLILDDEDANIFDNFGNLQSAGLRAYDKLYDCLCLILENTEKTFEKIDDILRND